MQSTTMGSFEGRRCTSLAVHAMVIAVVLLFSACKGSSSETQPTTAMVKLSTVGTLPAGKKIGTIDVTLTLAPGVTLKTGTDPKEPSNGVVLAGSAALNSLIATNYTAPTSTQPGKVRIAVISATGFGTGEFATINGDIATGNNPKAADFSIADFSVTDNENTSSPISGLTPGLSVDIQ